MPNLWESIRDLIAKLFRRDSNQRRLRVLDEMEGRFEAVRRDNEDQLHSLKDEIRMLEERAINKRHELDNTTGESRRIVVREIEAICAQLDRLRGREEIVAANLDRIGKAISKIGEARASLGVGVSEDEFDHIAIELQDLFGNLRQLDRAASELDKESYTQASRKEPSVEERAEAVPEETATEPSLSPAIEDRINNMRKKTIVDTEE